MAIDKVTLLSLERKVNDLTSDTPTYRGVAIDQFDREHLIMLCKLFADQWQKYQESYELILRDCLPLRLRPVRKSLFERMFGRKKNDNEKS